MNALQATFVSMSVSIGIAMHNATTNQNNGQMIATANMAMCCKLILSKAN